MKKKIKRTSNVLINSIVFFALIGTAFAIGWVFGLGFVLGYGIILYNREITKHPFRMIFIFVGGLLTRYALGKFLFEVPNAHIGLDFAVSLVMIVLIFIAGWKIRKK